MTKDSHFVGETEKGFLERQQLERGGQLMGIAPLVLGDSECHGTD